MMKNKAQLLNYWTLQLWINVIQWQCIRY